MKHTDAIKAQIIVCHPNVNSFNHAIAKKAEETLSGQKCLVTYHDLYQEKFDPVVSYNEIINGVTDGLTKRYIDDLLESEILIIVHPNWWGKPPALLAGWIDKVFRFNSAYTFPKGGEGGRPIGLLKSKKVFIFNTANTTDEREIQIFKDPLNLIWKNCVFDFCGVKDIVRKVFTVIVDSSSEQRLRWLDEVKQIILVEVTELANSKK